jgi:hypothetical protein
MNLSDAFSGGFADFDNTEAAPEFTPVPPGVYVARVQSGEATATRAGADAYRMRFEITEGPHTGRTLLRLWTFGEKARRYAQRDLGLFGITSMAQLFSPFPEAGREYVVRLVVALQRGNDGIAWNDVKSITVVRVTNSPAADFMLGEQHEGGAA